MDSVTHILAPCHMLTCCMHRAGRLFCNLKGLNAKQGDRLRVHVMSLGSQVRFSCCCRLLNGAAIMSFGRNMQLWHQRLACP